MQPLPLPIPTQRIYRLTDKLEGRHVETTTTQAFPFIGDNRFIVARSPFDGLFAVYLDVVGTKFSRHSYDDVQTAVQEFEAYRQQEGDRIEKYINMNWAIFMHGKS